MKKFNGECLIKNTGINADNGFVNLTLKAVNGTFDWTKFIASKEKSREILAIALAAITSNKNVFVQTVEIDDNKAWDWTQIGWVEIVG